MAKLSSTDIYGDLYVDGIISGVLSGSVSNNLIVKLNGGTTEGTNQFTFNGSATKTINITPSGIGALPSSGGTLTGYINLPATATSTNVNHPTQLAYGLLGAYGSLKVLGNTDTSAGADNEYVHIAAGWGLSPTTDKGIVYGSYAQCFGQNILTATHTASHAPVNAQKNSDITKAEIEAKLTGAITSHTHNYAASSHNHTSLTGITSLAFGGIDSSDTISITASASSATSYMDFNMTDDANSDMWRWRFSAWDSASNATAATFNAMTLMATSTTKAKLTVNGSITADSFNGLNFWTGTQSAYNNLSSKSATTVYFITG